MVFENVFGSSTQRCLPFDIVKVCNDKLENVHVSDTRGPWSLCKELFIEALKFILNEV